MYRSRRLKKKVVLPTPPVVTVECDCVVKIDELEVFRCDKKVAKDKTFKVATKGIPVDGKTAETKKVEVKTKPKLARYCGPWHYLLHTCPWTPVSECQFFHSAERMKVASDWSEKHGDTSWTAVLEFLKKSVLAKMEKEPTECKQKIINLDAILFYE